MLAVEIGKRRRRVFVELTPDTFPNRGGFFCQIYGDNSHDFLQGEFTISKKEIGHTENENASLKKAQVLANYKVSEMYR